MVRAPGKLLELAESTIAHRLFDSIDSDHDMELLRCIEVLLGIYTRHLDSPIRIDADRATWMRSRAGGSLRRDEVMTGEDELRHYAVTTAK